MNDLSWTLYFVDVFSSANKFLWFGFFVTVAVGVFYFLFWLNSESDGEKLSSSLKLLLKVEILLALFIIIVPSEKTLYLILGSEIGEEVVSSDTGQNVLDAINKKIEEYLQEEDGQ